MNKKKYFITFAILFFMIVIMAVLIVTDDGNKLKEKNISFKKENILNITNEEKKVCKKKIVELLNQLEYLDISEITFYNNSFDKSINNKYFYALLDDEDKTLLEIKRIGNESFKVTYLSNNNFMHEKVGDSNVTYAQIVDPKAYKKEKELEEIRKEGEKAAPDDRWVG